RGIRRSPRSIGPIARIAKARDDKSVVVKALVDSCSPDMHVGMNAAQALECGRHGDEANVPDVAGAALLEPINGGDCGIGRGGSPPATGVLGVPITGATTMTSRSATSTGALKKYSTATSVWGSRYSPMWATRADGTNSNMPSTNAMPARRIGANTSFLPAIR